MSSIRSSNTTGVGTNGQSYSIFRLLRPAGEREFAGCTFAPRRKVRPKVNSEICNVLLEQAVFWFRIGWVRHARLNLDASSFARHADACGADPTVFRDICNGCIRILGDLFRFRDLDQESQGWPLPERSAGLGGARAKLRNWAEACAARNGVVEAPSTRRSARGYAASGGHTFTSSLQPRHLLNPRGNRRGRRSRLGLPVLPAGPLTRSPAAVHVLPRGSSPTCVQTRTCADPPRPQLLRREAAAYRRAPLRLTL